MIRLYEPSSRFKQRELAMLEALLLGKSGEDVANEYDIGVTRVWQLTKRLRSELLQPFRLYGQNLPKVSDRIIDMRKHKAFWLHQLDLYRQELIASERRDYAGKWR